MTGNISTGQWSLPEAGHIFIPFLMSSEIPTRNASTRNASQLERVAYKYGVSPGTVMRYRRNFTVKLVEMLLMPTTESFYVTLSQNVNVIITFIIYSKKVLKYYYSEKARRKWHPTKRGALFLYERRNPIKALKAIAENLASLPKLLMDLSEELELEPTPSIKFEDVRKVLAEISKLGKTRVMKALISKYGAVKLSEVKPKDYAELLSSAKEIANA